MLQSPSIFSLSRSLASALMGFPLYEMKPVVWLPSPIHSEAYALAESLFTLITPSSPNAADWPLDADGSIVRKGGITEEELIRSAGKLRIISRNGSSSLPPSPSLRHGLPDRRAQALATRRSLLRSAPSTLLSLSTRLPLLPLTRPPPAPPASQRSLTRAYPSTS